MLTEKRSAEFQLLTRLRYSVVLRAMGCSVTRGLTGSVCLTVDGNSIGAWWYEGGQYRYGKIAHCRYSAEATSVHDAVATTVELVTDRIAALGTVA